MREGGKHFYNSYHTYRTVSEREKRGRRGILRQSKLNIGYRYNDRPVDKILHRYERVLHVAVCACILTRIYMFIYTLDDSLTECISRAYMQTNPTDGLAIIYRPVPCATTISVKCVTVKATAKASFDFSLVTINLWFMPLRVEYAQPARYRSLPNHAWDRPVAKIGLVATTVCIGLFTLRDIPTMQIGEHRSECQRNHREVRIASWVSSWCVLARLYANLNRGTSARFRWKSFFRRICNSNFKKAFCTFFTRPLNNACVQVLIYILLI